MQSPARARVYRLRIVPPAQRSFSTRTDAELIVDTFQAGRRVRRYSREWLVGHTDVLDGTLVGKIGFQSEGETFVEVWDEALNDFATYAVTQGFTMPFAVDLDSLLLLVQPRAQVKLNGVIGAMEAMLDQRTQERGWRIISTGPRITRQAWLDSVERVTEVRLVVRQPNPHWQDADDLQAVMETAAADVARLVLAASGGIDLDAPFLQQTLGHVDRNYGEGTLTGVRSDGRVSTFSTRLEAEELPEQLPVQDTGEVARETLKQALGASQTPAED